MKVSPPSLVGSLKRSACRAELEDLYSTKRSVSDQLRNLRISRDEHNEEIKKFEMISNPDFFSQEDVQVDDDDITSNKSDCDSIDDKFSSTDEDDLHSNRKEIQGTRNTKSMPLYPFGRNRRGKRVDFLFEDLVRKTRRKYWEGDSKCCTSFEELSSTYTIGPHPLTDHKLSSLIIYDTKNSSPSTKSSGNAESAPLGLAAIPAINYDNLEKNLPCFHAREISHSEWFIDDSATESSSSSDSHITS